MKRVYVCEDSVEGILSGVYQAFVERNGHSNNRLELGPVQQPEFFCEYVEVKAEAENAKKVIQSIKDKISIEAWHMVYSAAVSDVEGKADSIYRFLQAGYHIGRTITEYLNYPAVQEIFSMERRVHFEDLRYRQFIRFHELESGAFFAKIRPKCDILTMTVPHFADRMADEDFIICDVARQYAAVHPANKEWFLISTESLDLKQLEIFSAKEEVFQKLYREFVDTIAIKERINPRQQLNMLPKRYREFMDEMLKL